MELKHFAPPEDSTSQGIEYMDYLFDGMKRFALLGAARDLGLFDWLAVNENSTEEAIADSIGIRGLFCRPFLRALVDMGLLRHAADKTFANTELAQRLLTSAAPTSAVPCLDLLTSPHSYWTNLKELLSDRSSFAELARRHRADERFIPSQLAHFTRGELPIMLRQISDWERFAQASTLLAAGDGGWALALSLCQLHPGLAATVLVDEPDYEPVMNLVGEKSMTGRIRIETAPLAGEQVEPRSPCDLVVLAHALYPYRKQLEETLAEVAGLVVENGLLASCHWFCGTECQPPSEQPPVASDRAAIQVLERAFYSGGHPLCFHAKFPDHLRSAGFTPLPPKTLPTSFGLAQLHLATR